MHCFVRIGSIVAALGSIAAALGGIVAALGMTACQRVQPLDPTAVTRPRIVGRAISEASGAQRIAWSDTQIVAAFSGDSVAVHMVDVPPPPAGKIGNVYDVIIDGRPPRVIALHAAQELYPLEDGLGAGPHTLTLIKRTEAALGESRFIGLKLAPEGRLLPPPPAATRHLEVIGDSISAGYGNEGTDANCRFSPLTENGDLAYGPMAARALGADASVIARSGHGLIRNRDLTTEELLPELYRRSLPSADANDRWQPRGAPPDTVIINLGTNDFAPGVPDLQQFTAAYIRLVSDVRRNAPKAHIFLALGPMLSDDFPQKARHLSIARQVHQDIVAQLAAHGDSHVSLIEFPTQDGRRGFGCDWHPSLATHAAMAAQLAAAIRATLSW